MKPTRLTAGDSAHLSDDGKESLGVFPLRCDNGILIFFFFKRVFLKREHTEMLTDEMT